MYVTNRMSFVKLRSTAVIYCHCGADTLDYHYGRKILEDELPVVKGPSAMKNDPTVMAAAATNLKNQNLQKKDIPVIKGPTDGNNKT